MYSSITIIFNPSSTGDASRNAQELEHNLRKYLPNLPVKLQKTKHAGHAEDLAYRASKKGQQPLIVTASGDGGYHEVINGAMRAKKEGATPVCAVLASGNANDHRRIVRKRPLAEAIIAQDISKLDLLEVRWNDKTRFAHSYVGLGITPVVANELNRHDLNSFKELVLVVKTFWKYQPFEIKLNNKIVRLDNLVLANISGMAKVLKLSKGGKPADGKFEVVMVPHRRKISMLAWALKSATIGLGKQPQKNKFMFTTTSPMPMQLDGEVVELPAKTKVSVTIAHRLLKTIR